MAWIIENGILTEPEQAVPVDFPSYPLVPALWRVTANGPTTGFHKNPPVQNKAWVIGENGLQTKSMSDPIYLGAFANQPTLVNVSIPSTVKSIGRYAFYNTGINHVKIASDCHYYATSFPPGTIVEFYEEEEPEESEGENDG